MNWLLVLVTAAWTLPVDVYPDDVACIAAAEYAKNNKTVKNEGARSEPAAKIDALCIPVTDTYPRNEAGVNINVETHRVGG